MQALSEKQSMHCKKKKKMVADDKFENIEADIITDSTRLLLHVHSLMILTKIPIHILRFSI